MEIVRGVALVVGVAAVGVGMWQDVEVSERERPEGWLWGTLRAPTLKGLARGLPFYVVGATGIGLAAFLP